MSEESSTEFVSRRGKRTVAVATDTPHTAADTPKKPRRTLWRPRLRLSLRAWILVLLAALLVVVSAVVHADSIKRDYERQSGAMKRSIADAGAVVPSADASASSVSERLLQSLNAPTACRVNGLDVAAVYPPARSSRQVCVDYAKKYLAVKESLQSFSASARYVEKLGSLYESALSQPSDSGYAIAQDYAANWSKALDDLAATSPPSQFATAHATLQTKTQAVKTAWESFAAANSAQDAAAFTAAESQLQAAYTDFRACADSLRSAIDVSQQALASAIASL